MFQNSELDRERGETGKTETQRPRLERPHTEPKEFQNSSTPLNKIPGHPTQEKQKLFSTFVPSADHETLRIGASTRTTHIKRCW